MKYTYVENKNTGQPAIKLLEEPFAGIIYCYENVSIDENEQTSTIDMNFEYEILDKANKDFGNMEPFEKYIGDVLQDILHNMVKEEMNE
jgi:hypothetical protein